MHDGDGDFGHEPPHRDGGEEAGAAGAENDRTLDWVWHSLRPIHFRFALSGGTLIRMLNNRQPSGSCSNTAVTRPVQSSNVSVPTTFATVPWGRFWLVLKDAEMLTLSRLTPR